MKRRDATSTSWCEPEQVGQQISQGTLLGWVCSSDSFLLVPLSDELLTSVTVGTQARIQWSGPIPMVQDATVRSIVQLDTAQVNPLVGPSLPEGTRFGAVIDVSTEQLEGSDLRPGQAVNIVFCCDSRTLANRSLDWLCNNLRLVAD